MKHILENGGRGGGISFLFLGCTTPRHFRERSSDSKELIATRCIETHQTHTTTYIYPTCGFIAILVLEASTPCSDPSDVASVGREQPPSTRSFPLHLSSARPEGHVDILQPSSSLGQPWILDETRGRDAHPTRRTCLLEAYRPRHLLAPRHRKHDLHFGSSET